MISTLTAEIAELLKDFEKRMKFINIVRYFTECGMPNNIRDIFGGSKDRTNNLIVMVMIFIMDHTLRYDDNCKKHDIEGFIEEASELYGIDKSHSPEITEYILTDVLQNSGKPMRFDTFSSQTMQFEEIPRRLITESNGLYKLTDEAYDFIFRTKEIETELDFSVSRFKLNEFIKRGNYSKALNQSRELVNRIRSLKTRMDDFELRCRENVSTISIDEYEDIVLHVNSVFESEQKELDDIRRTVSTKLTQIIDAVQNGESIANAGQLEKDISEILKNITITLSEQNRVYNKKFSLSESYGKQLDEDFTYFTTRRFSFEKEIMLPSQKLSSESAIRLQSLFYPLYKPHFRRFFSIANLYDKQQKLREKSDDDFIDIDGFDVAEDKCKSRNERYINIIRSFMDYASSHDFFRISTFISKIPLEKIKYYCEENTLFNVILKLYSFGSIDIDEWRNSKDYAIVPNGELDLSYCLGELSDNILEMSRIVICRSTDTFEIAIENNTRITLSDFDVEVIK